MGLSWFTQVPGAAGPSFNAISGTLSFVLDNDMGKTRQEFTAGAYTSR